MQKYNMVIFKNNKDLLDKGKYNGIEDEIKELEKIIEENKFNLDKKNLKKNEDNLVENEEKINQSQKSEFSELSALLKKEYEKLKNLPFEELQTTINILL